jgi:regulator of replication initiation timing
MRFHVEQPDIEERLKELDAATEQMFPSLGETIAKFESLRAELERLRALLRRHQVAAWCEDDSDLAVETRAALERKS